MEAKGRYRTGGRKGTMRNDAGAEMNSCTGNARGEEDRRTDSGLVVIDQYWDENLKIKGLDVHLERQLRDGR